MGATNLSSIINKVNKIKRIDTPRINVSLSDEIKYFSYGSFCTVYKFQGSSEYVLKVFKTSTSKGTYEFLKFCLDNHHNNEFLPKVYHLTKVGKYSLAVMERLTCNRKKAEKFFDEAFYKFNSRNVLLRKTSPKKLKETFKTLRQIKNKTASNFDMHSSNILFRNEVPVISDPLFEPKAYAKMLKDWQ